MARILVTGGAGFIGSHLCEKLLLDGHQVYSVDDYSAGSPDNHIEGVVYIEGSTAEIEKFFCAPFDLIYHLGEYARVEQSFLEIEKVLEKNVRGTHSILEFARKHKTKIVYAGSSTKFADGGIGRDQSPYAWTKATNTELVRNYGEWYGLEYAITYFYNVYGPRERGDEKTGTLIGIYRDLYKKGEPLPVRLPGNQRRNFTHVADIVNGLKLVGEKGDGDGYGIGHHDSYSVREVAAMFSHPVMELPERPGNRMSSAADTKRTRLELGWSPQFDLPGYVKSLIDAHKKLSND
jgi:UDP-glucose 4-epimerase